MDSIGGIFHADFEIRRVSENERIGAGTYDKIFAADLRGIAAAVDVNRIVFVEAVNRIGAGAGGEAVDISADIFSVNGIVTGAAVYRRI